MVFSNETKRIVLFLIGCMGARSLLVYLAYQKSTRLYVALFTALVAIGFMYIFITGSRKTGPEVFGDRIWWNDLRPVHATLYVTAALMIWSDTYSNDAWKVLLLDLFIGLFAFINKHFLL
jgi:hypothetical protein